MAGLSIPASNVSYYIFQAFHSHFMLYLLPWFPALIPSPCIDHWDLPLLMLAVLTIVPHFPVFSHGYCHLGTELLHNREPSVERAVLEQTQDLHGIDRDVAEPLVWPLPLILLLCRVTGMTPLLLVTLIRFLKFLSNIFHFWHALSPVWFGEKFSAPYHPVIWPQCAIFWFCLFWLLQSNFLDLVCCSGLSLVVLCRECYAWYYTGLNLDSFRYLPREFYWAFVSLVQINHQSLGSCLW